MIKSFRYVGTCLAATIVCLISRDASSQTDLRREPSPSIRRGFTFQTTALVGVGVFRENLSNNRRAQACFTLTSARFSARGSRLFLACTTA